jgi:WD40 repeat protein
VTGRWRWREQLSSATFSRDSARLAFVDTKGRVGVWTRSGQVRILGRDREAYSAEFTRNGDVVVTSFNNAGDDRTRVWPLDGGPPRRLRKDESPYDAVAPVGGLSATLDKGRVHLWRGGAPAGDLVNPTRSVGTDVAFSPDGQSAATADEQGTARVWDVASRTSIALRGHVATVNSVSFSPNGQLVVTAGADGTVRVWQAASGASVAVLLQQAGPSTQPSSAPTAVSWRRAATTESSASTTASRAGRSPTCSARPLARYPEADAPGRRGFWEE